MYPSKMNHIYLLNYNFLFVPRWAPVTVIVVFFNICRFGIIWILLFRCIYAIFPKKKNKDKCGIKTFV